MDAPQYLLDCVLAPAFYRSHAALYSKDYAHEKNSSPFLHARYARASTLNFFGPQCLKTPAPLWSHSDKPPFRYKTLMKSLTMTVRACHYPHIPPLIDHVEKKIAPFYPCFFLKPHSKMPWAPYRSWTPTNLGGRSRSHDGLSTSTTSSGRAGASALPPFSARLSSGWLMATSPRIGRYLNVCQ